MSYKRRIYFTSEQKSEIWDRWQRGDSYSKSQLAGVNLRRIKYDLFLTAVNLIRHEFLYC